jgi:hypothetical protein
MHAGKSYKHIYIAWPPAKTLANKNKILIFFPLKGHRHPKESL